MSKPKAIGIDLGTTNSCVAWVDELGHTAMIPNTEGELLTPSVVLFDDSEVVVGKEARNACIVEPGRVAIWVKRDMGAPVYSRPIRGEYLPPEVIQACILRKLRSEVAHLLGPESQVVITVPAYFDEPRRKATADAGEMGGLRVLDIVNEPTAGALAFGETLGYLTPESAPHRSLTVLVYDLGGGTFDSTLLKLSAGNVKMIATDGDVQLGGYDWDTRLLNSVADQFRQAYGSDPRDDPHAASRLYREVIDAKHTLSSRMHTKVRLDHAGHHFECEVTRQAFEEMTTDLLERTAYTTRQLLATAHMDWKEVDRIFLVGGSTRMPMVLRMLEQMSGIRPDHTVNPDEAVARGAALYAHYLLGKTTAGAKPAKFEVTNVNAHSLGVEGIDTDTMRKRNVILIPRNSILPAKVTQRFATKSDGQHSIVIQVLEGESSLPSECTAIGRTVIRDLPAGLPKGWPVEVTFEYGRNSRLTVRAMVPGTRRETALDLERDVGLSNEGIARWKQAVASPGSFESFASLLVDAYRLAPRATAARAAAGGSEWMLPSAAGASPAVARAAGVAPLPAVPVSPAAPPQGPVPAAPNWSGGSAGPMPSAERPGWPAQPPTFAQPDTTAPWQVPTAPGQGQPGWPEPAAMQPPAQPRQPQWSGGMPGTYPASPAPGYAAGPPGPEMPPLPPVPGAAQAPPAPFLAEPRRRAAPAAVRWIINLAGHITAALLGLGVGYLFLSRLHPDRFPLPRWFPFHW